MKFKIPVQWIEVGEFEVEANSLAEAIDKVEGNEDDQFPIGRAGGEYLDDSFQVNKELIEEIDES